MTWCEPFFWFYVCKIILRHLRVWAGINSQPSPVPTRSLVDTSRAVWKFDLTTMTQRHYGTAYWSHAVYPTQVKVDRTRILNNFVVVIPNEILSFALHNWHCYSCLLFFVLRLPDPTSTLAGLSWDKFPAFAHASPLARWLQQYFTRKKPGA